MSSVIANLLVNGVSGVTVGGTGTAAKFFPMVPGASIGVASSNVGYIYLPNANQVNGQRLSVRASGIFSVLGAACSTVTLEMVATKNVTAASPTYTVIASSGSFTTSGDGYAVSQFAFSVDLIADGASGLLSGSQQVIINNALQNTTPKVLSNTITGLTPSTDKWLALAMRVTFGTSDAANTSTMYQFDVQQ